MYEAVKCVGDSKRNAHVAKQQYPVDQVVEEQCTQFGDRVMSKALDVVSIVESGISSMPIFQRSILVRSSPRGVAV